MRFRFAFIVLICALLPTGIRAEAAVLAIADPHALRELDGGSLGLGRMLASRAAPLTNEALFA